MKSRKLRKGIITVGIVSAAAFMISSAPMISTIQAEETGTVTSYPAQKKGWVKEGGGYKYYKNGKAYTGWHYMSSAEGERTPHYSYFGSDGILRTGWQSMGRGTKNSYGEN